MKIRVYRYLLLISFLLIVVLIILLVTQRSKNSGQNEIMSISPVGSFDSIDSINRASRWKRCFIATDGSIYFKNNKVSTDRGASFREQIKDLKGINGNPGEGSVLTTGKMLYALDGRTVYVSPGVYKGKSQVSTDNLKNIKQEEVIFHIPEGPEPRKDIKGWFGMFVYRNILVMPDSSWLMTMYGHFKTDTLIPYDKDAKREIAFMGRTIVLSSHDKGHTWEYLSTVAAPGEGEPVGEGFVEPAITLLKDGRLLCIMRAGHLFPLYACWSSDKGKTWTLPMYTGLDRGCDPCLITLHDGRIVLSWGRRFPEGWSVVSPEGDKGRFRFPGEGSTNLSISNDGGLTWNTSKILQKSGTCYSIIFEVEPNVIFMQVDQWFCRIKLNLVSEKKL